MDHQMMQQEDQRRRLEAIIRADTDLIRLLGGAQELDLPQWRVVAGCLYQTVLNVLANKPPRTGIKDYDLIYFDETDLSWGAEDQVVRHATAHMTDLPVPVEVRNQARVHLWFKQRFGANYTPLRCADEARRGMRPSFTPWVYVWKPMVARTLSHHSALTISSTWLSNPTRLQTTKHRTQPRRRGRRRSDLRSSSCHGKNEN